MSKIGSLRPLSYLNAPNNPRVPPNQCVPLEAPHSFSPLRTIQFSVLPFPRALTHPAQSADRKRTKLGEPDDVELKTTGRFNTSAERSRVASKQASHGAEVGGQQKRKEGLLDFCLLRSCLYTIGLTHVLTQVDCGVERGRLQSPDDRRTTRERKAA